MPSELVTSSETTNSATSIGPAIPQSCRVIRVNSLARLADSGCGGNALRRRGLLRGLAGGDPCYFRQPQGVRPLHGIGKPQRQVLGERPDARSRPSPMFIPLPALRYPLVARMRSWLTLASSILTTVATCAVVGRCAIPGGRISRVCNANVIILHVTCRRKAFCTCR